MTLAWATESYEIEKALVTAIRADANLSALLADKKVYSVIAPQGTTLPYITLGSTTAVPSSTFKRLGTAGTVLLHIWSRTSDSAPSKLEILQIWGYLRNVLRGQILALGNGFGMMASSIDLVDVQLDQDRQTMHGVVRYQYRARLL